MDRVELWKSLVALVKNPTRQQTSIYLPKSFLGVLSRLPRPVRRILRFGYRRRLARSYYKDELGSINKWAWSATESTNFNYRLDALNREYLAQMISAVTGAPLTDVIAYFAELENDSELKSHLANSYSQSSLHYEARTEFGRRLGWYAFVRILKPRLVVETGVDEGLGACVLSSAILRNREEGHSGTYLGTEIRETAGALFSGKYSEAGEILWGDSLQSLAALDQKIGLFINDSDHSESYEYNEYCSVTEKLAPGAIILGDNSHVSRSLSRYSIENGRRFLFFDERPANHWFPGCGIGISHQSS
jgi:predicted O-methyltransferase YrrM